MPGLAPSPDPVAGLWSLIAHHLRFLRLQKGLSQASLGAIISVSVPSVSRLELGLAHLDEAQAAKIDKSWDTGGLFGFLVYHAIRGHEADWQVQYVHLEATAHILRIYDALVVPSIFQTPEYARALLLSGQFASRADELVAERMKRSSVLDRESPADVWVILSENVLDWPVGGPEVMRDQLKHLLDLAQRGNVGIRVVPRDSGASPAMDGSFKIMTLESGDVAFSESPGGGRLVHDPEEVRRYLGRYERIGSHALPRLDSRALIHQRMEGFS